MRSGSGKCDARGFGDRAPTGLGVAHPLVDAHRLGDPPTDRAGLGLSPLSRGSWTRCRSCRQPARALVEQSGACAVPAAWIRRPSRRRRRPKTARAVSDLPIWIGHETKAGAVGIWPERDMSFIMRSAHRSGTAGPCTSRSRDAPPADAGILPRGPMQRVPAMRQVGVGSCSAKCVAQQVQRQHRRSEDCDARVHVRQRIDRDDLLEAASRKSY